MGVAIPQSCFGQQKKVVGAGIDTPRSSIKHRTCVCADRYRADQSDGVCWCVVITGVAAAEDAADLSDSPKVADTPAPQQTGTDAAAAERCVVGLDQSESCLAMLFTQNVDLSS